MSATNEKKSKKRAKNGKEKEPGVKKEPKAIVVDPAPATTAKDLVEKFKDWLPGDRVIAPFGLGLSSKDRSDAARRAHAKKELDNLLAQSKLPLTDQLIAMLVDLITLTRFAYEQYPTTLRIPYDALIRHRRSWVDGALVWCRLTQGASMSSMALYKAIPDFCRYHHAHQRGKMSTHFRAHRGAKNTNETELEIIELKNLPPRSTYALVHHLARHDLAVDILAELETTIFRTVKPSLEEMAEMRALYQSWLRLEHIGVDGSSKILEALAAKNAVVDSDMVNLFYRVAPEDSVAFREKWENLSQSERFGYLVNRFDELYGKWSNLTLMEAVLIGKTKSEELEKALKEKGEFEKKLEELMDASLYQKYMFDQTESEGLAVELENAKKKAAFFEAENEKMKGLHEDLLKTLAARSSVSSSLKRSTEVVTETGEKLVFEEDRALSARVLDMAIDDRDLSGEDLITRIRRNNGYDLQTDASAQKVLKQLSETLEGALLKLAEDIYSSDSRFALEIIQNADDNAYRTGTGSIPHLSIRFADGFVWTSNNELGFSSDNVLAVCSINKSTKKGTAAIGRKGIGFKSVFKVTDRPHVFSNQYRFRFDKKRPLGYIVPEWIDEEIATSELPSACKIDPAMTHFFLPYKEKHDFKPEDIFKGVDTIPLFLRKLHSIAIEVESGKNTFDRKQVRVDKTKEIRSSTDSLASVDLAFSSSEMYQTTLLVRTEHAIETVDGVEKPERVNELVHTYHVYRKRFKVPAHLEDNATKSKYTEIVLSFPKKTQTQGKERDNLDEDEESLDVDIYAFLPVGVVGFRFMIQADFDLVSSRQAVHHGHDWNKWLVSHVPGMFLEAFEADDYIRENFAKFIPRLNEVKDKFWSSVVRQIHQRLKGKAYVPTESGGFLEPERVFVRPVDFNNLITNAELKEATGCEFIKSSISDEDARSIFQARWIGVEQVVAVAVGIPQLCEQRGAGYVHRLLQYFIDHQTVFDDPQYSTLLREIKMLPLWNGKMTSLREGKVFLHSFGDYNLGNTIRLLKEEVVEAAKADRKVMDFLQRRVGIESTSLRDTADAVLQIHLFYLSKILKSQIESSPSAKDALDKAPNEEDSFDDLNPELVWEHVRFFRENKDALDKSDGFTKLLSETLLLPKKNGGFGLSRELYFYSEELYSLLGDKVNYIQLEKDNKSMRKFLASLGVSQYPRLVRAWSSLIKGKNGTKGQTPNQIEKRDVAELSKEFVDLLDEVAASESKLKIFIEFLEGSDNDEMITSYSNCLALKERFIALRFRTAEGSLKPASAICFDEKKTYSAFYSSINVPSEDLGLKSERIAKLLGFEVGVGVIIDCIRMGLIDRNVVDVETWFSFYKLLSSNNAQISRFVVPTKTITRIIASGNLVWSGSPALAQTIGITVLSEHYPSEAKEVFSDLGIPETFSAAELQSMLHFFQIDDEALGDGITFRPFSFIRKHEASILEVFTLLNKLLEGEQGKAKSADSVSKIVVFCEDLIFRGATKASDVVVLPDDERMAKIMAFHEHNDFFFVHPGLVPLKQISAIYLKMGVRKLSALSVSRPWIDETLIRQVYLEMVYRLCLYRAVDFAEKVLEKEEIDHIKTIAEKLQVYSLQPDQIIVEYGVKGFRSVKKSPEPFYYDAKKHFLFVPGKGMAILYRALEKMLPFASYDCEKVFNESTIEALLTEEKKKKRIKIEEVRSEDLFYAPLNLNAPPPKIREAPKQNLRNMTEFGHFIGLQPSYSSSFGGLSQSSGGLSSSSSSLGSATGGSGFGTSSGGLTESADFPRLPGQQSVNYELNGDDDGFVGSGSGGGGALVDQLKERVTNLGRLGLDDRYSNVSDQLKPSTTISASLATAATSAGVMQRIIALESRYGELIGEVAELAFYKSMKAKHGDAFTPAHWVSHYRCKYFPDEKAPIQNDSGYDFVFNELFFEVKGHLNPLPLGFNLSSNEVAVMKREGGRYCIVGITLCDYPNGVEVYRLNDPAKSIEQRHLTLEPNQYFVALPPPTIAPTPSTPTSSRGGNKGLWSKKGASTPKTPSNALSSANSTPQSAPSQATARGRGGNGSQRGGGPPRGQQVQRGRGRGGLQAQQPPHQMQPQQEQGQSGQAQRGHDRRGRVRGSADRGGSSQSPRQQQQQ